jgi:penicillin-binding protein 1A
MSNKPEDKTPNKKTKNKKKKTKLIVKALWGVFAIGIFAIVLDFILISTGAIGYMPNIQNLENPIDKYASQVYAADGEMMGTYSLAKNNRIYSSYKDLPPHLVQALVDTEDERYYDHSGIDITGLMTAVYRTFTAGRTSGASTISQQLAKLLYTEKPADDWLERVFIQKPNEWVIAARLEKYYTKDEIINLYLNKYDFNYQAVGIKSAAQIYFNKDLNDLNVEESAMLVGMLNNSSYYNPLRRTEITKTRRNVVLAQMYKAGHLTRAQTDSLQALPLKLDFRRADHNEGIAPYFREYLRLAMNATKPDKSKYAAWQKDQFRIDSLNWERNPLYGWCNKNKKANGTNYNLSTDGLKIYTTIDSRMQKYAEDAMEEHMSKTVQPAFEKEKKGRAYAPFSYRHRNDVDTLLYRAMKNSDRYRSMKKAGMSENDIYRRFKQPAEMKIFSWKGEIDTTMTPWDSIRYNKSFLRAGFMAQDVHTGYVRAYVGGIDFKYFKYDMVNMGRRQVGSTIKPYLYTLAMEEGATPCDQMLYEQQVLTDEVGRPYIPRGIKSNKVGEMVTIKWGLQASDNMVTMHLMSRTSPYAFERLLRSFGLTGHIDPVISMALGTPEVTVAEMAASYTAFANKGFRSNSIYVTHIEDQYGNIIANFNPRLEEVFSEGSYVKMLDMLRGVVDGGTGGRIRRYVAAGPLGGKTGTTNYNMDGWFMCFSPTLSTACWVGGEETSIHFDNMGDGQGASMALPIAGIFLKKVYADGKLGYTSNDQFATVPGVGNPCAKAVDEEIPDSSGGIDEMFN